MCVERHIFHELYHHPQTCSKNSLITHVCFTNSIITHKYVSRTLSSYMCVSRTLITHMCFTNSIIKVVRTRWSTHVFFTTCLPRTLCAHMCVVPPLSSHMCVSPTLSSKMDQLEHTCRLQHVFHTFSHHTYVFHQLCNQSLSRTLSSKSVTNSLITHTCCTNSIIKDGQARAHVSLRDVLHNLYHHTHMCFTNSVIKDRSYTTFEGMEKLQHMCVFHNIHFTNFIITHIRVSRTLSSETCLGWKSSNTCVYFTTYISPTSSSPTHVLHELYHQRLL